VKQKDISRVRIRER